MSTSAGRPPTTPRRRGGVLRWVFLALLLLPFLEISVLVLVGQSIGIWWTLGLIVALTVVGIWLARRETGRTYRALQQAMRSGTMPADEMTDAILVMLGAFFLILPGFVSDAVGLLLVLPFTRPVFRRLLQAVVASRAIAVIGGTPGGVAGGTGFQAPRRRPGRGQVVEGEIVSEQPPPGGPDASEHPRLEP